MDNEEVIMQVLARHRKYSLRIVWKADKDSSPTPSGASPESKVCILLTDFISLLSLIDYIIDTRCAVKVGGGVSVYGRESRLY